MTLLNRYLAQCIAWCEVNQKEHAWKLAQTAEANSPELLEGLCASLTATMRARAKDQSEQGEKNE